jgi:hypothetical protein
MRSARLLLVVPAATALVFTGLSPASATDDHNGHGGDAWAKVLEIDDEAEVKDHGDEVEVRFKYKCEDDGEDVEARVTLDNDARYEQDDVELDCDGDAHWKTVTLEKKGHDEVEDGDDVEVTVKIKANGDELDEKTEDVEVEDDHNGRHHYSTVQ